MTETQTAEKQSTQLSAELVQQINLLSARMSSANLANADLQREVDATLKAMGSGIFALKKENTELKSRKEKS
jgi:hypothetical protein